MNEKLLSLKFYVAVPVIVKWYLMEHSDFSGDQVEYFLSRWHGYSSTNDAVRHQIMMRKKKQKGINLKKLILNGNK